MAPRPSWAFALRLLASLLALIAGGILETSYAQSCPADVIRMGITQLGFGTASYATASLDTTWEQGDWYCEMDCCGYNCPHSGHNFTGRVAYDWTTGNFEVGTLSVNRAGWVAITALDASDSFVVRGLSAPATARARLAVHMNASGGFTGSAELQATLASSLGPAVSDTRSCGYECSFDILLETPLTVTTDIPFSLSVRLQAKGQAGYFDYFGSSRGVATLSFVDLPPGATIRSCKGYPEAVTRQIPTSWGRLKARYR